MMTSDVNVWVKGVQTYGGDASASEPIITTSTGKYREIRGRIHVIYEEAIDENPAAVRTHLVVGETTLEVHRSGDVKTDMLFSLDEPTECVYSTAFGNLHMAIRTHFIRTRVCEEHIEVCVRYDLFAGGELSSRNEMVIKVSAM